ncbi:hypothetical protein BDW22DRAFT_1354268 [Trametopsis cervina]|nr:hypothetical protein BDW22DRAFT_1354268 [Trametopsis cervina]
MNNTQSNTNSANNRNASPNSTSASSSNSPGVPSGTVNGVQGTGQSADTSRTGGHLTVSTSPSARWSPQPMMFDMDMSSDGSASNSRTGSLHNTPANPNPMLAGGQANNMLLTPAASTGALLPQGGQAHYNGLGRGHQNGLGRAQANGVTHPPGPIHPSYQPQAPPVPQAAYGTPVTPPNFAALPRSQWTQQAGPSNLTRQMNRYAQEQQNPSGSGRGRGRGQGDTRGGH